MKCLKTTIAAAIFSALSLTSAQPWAQSLTADQLKAMVEQRVSGLNPYQELLNDPDPERSRAAMQIMLESGDRELVRMALEFGLMSPNPTVKRAAFESYVTTSPIFSIRLDGSKVKDRNYAGVIRDRWNGNLGTDGIAYWRIAVGPYLPESKCHANTQDPNQCFVTVNSDGIFLTASYLTARGTITDEGVFSGIANLAYVDEPVPFTIQLLD